MCDFIISASILNSVRKLYYYKELVDLPSVYTTGIAHEVYSIIVLCDYWLC